MKNIFKLSFVVVSLFSTSLVFAAKAPIQSKEEIEFLTKSENKMIGFTKTPEFTGVMVRTAQANAHLRDVDLYSFKETSKISMDEGLCKEYLSKIYGPLNEISLKVRKVEIFSSHTGKTCEAQIENEDPQAKIPERRTVLGFVNAKPYGLVFKFSKKSTSDEQNDVRKFWDSLR